MSDPARPKPYQPRGAVDGIVCDTTLAKKMGFSARWGTSCGIPFNKTEFCKQNIIWKDQEPYLHDRLQQPWTEFTVHGDTPSDPTRKNKGDTSSAPTRTPSSPTRKNKTKSKEQQIAKIKKTKKAKLKGLEALSSQ
jgi:hypothetical protein